MQSGGQLPVIPWVPYAVARKRSATRDGHIAKILTERSGNMDGMERKEFMNRLCKTGKRMIAVFLVLIMLAGALPGEVFARFRVTAYALTDMAGATVVTTYEEFRAALRSGQEHVKIRLGADIKLPTDISVSSGPRIPENVKTLIIDGSIDGSEERYTLTDRSWGGDGGTNDNGNLYPASKDTTAVTFQNLNLRVGDVFGIVPAVDRPNLVITFEHCSIQARKLIHALKSAVVLRDSTVVVQNNGTMKAQVLAEANRVLLGGEVTITSAVDLQKPGKDSLFHLHNEGAALKIEDGANVLIQAAAGNDGLVHLESLSAAEFAVGANATFIYRGPRFRNGGDSNQFTSFTCGENSTTVLAVTGPLNGNEGIINVRGQVTVEQGARLYAMLKASERENEQMPLWFDECTVTLNNPREVVLYNGGTQPALGAYGKESNVAFHNINSIRLYQTTDEIIFDFDNPYDAATKTINYTNNQRPTMFWERYATAHDARPAHLETAFDVRGKFSGNSGRTAGNTTLLENLAQSKTDAQGQTYTGCQNYTPDAQTDMKAISFSGRKVVEIRGSYSAPPTVNPVVEGAKTVRGSGVPGAEIKVSSSSSEVAYAIVNEHGNWEAVFEAPLKRDETVTATQREYTARNNGFNDASVPAITVVLRQAEVTIVYQSDDGSMALQMTQKCLNTDQPFSVAPMALRGYALDRWVVTNAQGTEIASGAGSEVPVQIDPKHDAQTLTFTYKSTLAELMVRCYDIDGSQEIGKVQRFENIRIGDTFRIAAPVVTGYELKKGDPLIQSIELKAGANEIAFYYQKLTGGTLILREAVYDDNGMPVADKGSIIEYRSLNVTEGTEVEIPSLAGAYYTAVSTVKQQYEDAKKPITYYYDKNKMNVEIRAVDQDGTRLGYVTLEHAARVGEMYHAVTDLTVPDYHLAESAGKLVYADPNQWPLLVVPFQYSADKAADVEVKCFYYEGTEKIVLHHYAMTCPVGSKITVHAGAFDGFALVSPESDPEITVQDGGNLVFFEYKDMRKTVTVETQLGQEPAAVHSAEKHPAGTAVVVSPPNVYGYVATGFSLDGGEITAIDETFGGVRLGPVSQDHTVRFYYKTLEEVVDDGYVLITILGKTDDLDGKELYRFVKRVAKGAESRKVVEDYEVLRLSSWALKAGEAGKQSFIPDKDQTVTFYYEDNTQTVAISLVNRVSGQSIQDTIFVDGVEAGGRFSYPAPWIAGFKLVDASTGDITAAYTETINAVSENDNTIEFYYVPAAGNQKIIYWDAEADVQIGGDMIQLETGVKEVLPPATIEYYTTGDKAVEVTWNGATSLSPVVFRYTKQKADITLVGYDAVTGKEIESARHVAPNKRVMEYYDFQSDITALDELVPPGYTRLNPSSTSWHVEQSTQENIIKISYLPTPGGAIPVEVRAGSVTGDLLLSYPMAAAPGAAITLSDSQIPSLRGYEVDKAASILTATEGTGGKLIIVMTDTRKTVTVKTEIGGKQKIVATHKVVTGDGLYVPIPYIPGYVLAGFMLQGEGSSSSDESGVRLLQVKGDAEIIFCYQPIDELYVNILIKGVSGTTELYSYLITEQKEDAFKEVSPFVLSGYKTEDKAANLPLDGSVANHTFHYVNLETTVTIEMVDENGMEVAPRFDVAARTGDVFTYAAPHVQGYYLISASGTGEVTEVAAGGKSVLTFTYRKVTSLITLIAKEGDIDGRVIGVFAIDTSGLTAGNWTIGAPDLTGNFYTAATPQVAIVWDGIGSAVVEAYYTKDLTGVTVKCVDDATGGEINSTVKDGNRKGEAATIHATNLDGYVLVGAAAKTVVALDDTVVEFRYHKITSSEIAVKAIDDKTGLVLQGYQMTGTTGERVQVGAPSILGYVQLSSEPTSKAGIIGSDTEIVFRYVEDVVTIWVRLQDKTGATLSSPGYRSEINVARGGDCTVYAPHIPGYVLDTDCAASVDFAGLTQHVGVTFTYEKLEDIIADSYVELTIIASDGTSTLTSHTTLIAKNSPVTITAPKIPGYVLDPNRPENRSDGMPDGTLGIRTVNLAQPGAHTFYYTPMTTTVTIEMVNASGAPVADSFAVAATVGQAFSFHAPYVPGHYLTSPSSIGKVDSVQANGASKITFTYAVIASKATLIAMEDDENGRVIQTYELDTGKLTVGENTVAAPDLTGDYYTALTPQVRFVWDGTNAVEAKAYYAKERADVTIYGYEIGKDGPIYTGTLQSQRRGEVATVQAPAIPGYLLQSAAQQVVTVDGETPAEFYYTAALGEIFVKVTNSVTGARIEGAAVTVTDSADGQARSGSTDANGEVTFQGVAFGTYDITVTYPGYNRARAAAIVSKTQAGARVHIALGKPAPAGPATGTGTSYYALAFHTDGGSAITAVTAPSGTKIGLNDYTPVREGYTFAGWYADQALTTQVTEVTLTGNKTVYAKWSRREEINKDDHFAYMRGDGQGNFRPEASMTRGEAAQMIYNLLTDPSYESARQFSDIAPGAWYSQAVAALTAKGIITGYADGTFRPEAPISRAEFVAMLSRFTTMSFADGAHFKDVDTQHWAYLYIASASAKGWIAGYPDGSFKPEQSIARAEAAKIINALLDRSADEAYLDANPSLNRFPDVDTGHWAYYEMMEATIAHEYAKDERGKETWTSVK